MRLQHVQSMEMFQGCTALAELSHLQRDSLSIAVQASAEGGPEKVKGTVLLNCAGGMNTKVGALMPALTYIGLSNNFASHCISAGWLHPSAPYMTRPFDSCRACSLMRSALTQGLTDDWRVRLAFPIFRAIDFLLSRQRIARYLFNNFRTKDNLKRVLQRVYINPEAVDDALVDLIHTPSGLACKAHSRICHNTASVCPVFLQPVFSLFECILTDDGQSGVDVPTVMKT